MSFDRLDIKDNTTKEGRACIIICNLGGKELKTVKNCASILGIRDQIVLYSKNGDSIIKDILENNINSECEEGRREKAIIFNALSQAKINLLIENLRRLRMNNVLKAIVTDTSINWSINEVISNLVAERTAINNGNFTDQHEK